MGSTESPTRNITPISPFHNLAKNSGDPCQILEPARKTIETLEAQRIMAVLEDTIHRLELVMALQQVLQQLPRFRVMLGVELVDLCENHFTRQEQYWVRIDVIVHSLKFDCFHPSVYLVGSTCLETSFTGSSGKLTDTLLRLPKSGFCCAIVNVSE